MRIRKHRVQGKTHHGADEQGQPVYRLPQYLLRLCRQLRGEHTPAEQRLWRCLRNRRLLGVKFRRQHAVGRHVLDFYAHEARLGVELDGPSHDGAVERDEQRDAALARAGVRVVRFTNVQVMRHLPRVLEAIAQAVQPSPPCPSPNGRGVPGGRGEGCGGQGGPARGGHDRE